MDNNQKLDVVIEKSAEEDLSPDKPLSFGSYLDLPLTEEEKELYARKILKRINEIIEDQDRKDIMELAEGWRNQYLGILEETSQPFLGSFNLDMRMTAKIQDAVVSQAEEAFDDADPHWAVGPTPNKDVMSVRDKQEKVLDYYDDTEMRNNEDLESIRHDAFLLGTGFEALIFERKFIRVRDNKTYTSAQAFMQDFPNDFQKHPLILEDLAQGKPAKLNLEYNQEWRRSPRRTHVEFEDAIVPLDAKGVEGVNKADIKGVRKWYKWHEIKKMEDEGDFLPGVSERLKYKYDKSNTSGITEIDPDYKTKEFETFEMQYYIDIKINGKTRRVLTLWNIEKEHFVCLRAIRYPYDHMRSFLIPHNVKFTHKGLYQDGVGRMLQDPHIAANAIISHVLNSAILANSLSLKARAGTDAAKRVYEHQWYPGSVLELQNMNDVEQFTFSTPNLGSLVSLYAIVENIGQDAAGIVNYQIGQESQSDPEAPASKTFALMRKAEIKLRRYIKNLKRSEDEAGYQALRLIYQYIPVERLSQILGEDVSETKDFLQPAIRVITNASGFAIEKMFEKRDDMAMSQVLMNEPLVSGDPERRVMLWHRIAKSQGSNWDKKIIGIVPTPEEIKAQKEEAQRKLQARKTETAKGAAQKVLEQGGSEEDAREAGKKAIKMFDVMQEKAKSAQAQEKK